MINREQFRVPYSCNHNLMNLWFIKITGVFTQCAVKPSVNSNNLITCHLPRNRVTVTCFNINKLLSKCRADHKTCAAVCGVPYAPAMVRTQSLSLLCVHFIYFHVYCLSIRCICISEPEEILRGRYQVRMWPVRGSFPFCNTISVMIRTAYGVRRYHTLLS